MIKSSPRFLPSRLCPRVATLTLIALAVGCEQPQSRHVVRELPDPLVGMRPIRPGQAPNWPAERPRPTDVPVRPPERPPPVRPPESGHAWMPPGGISNRWECVVIHHSAKDTDSPQGMTEWHVNGRGWDELGYHFVIGNGVRFPDGEIYVGPRWTKQKHGAHCKVPGNYYNEHGIGICLIGDLNRHGPTAKQMESLVRLVSYLSRRCGIRSDRILTHGGVTHKTECPGRHFSVGAVRQAVARNQAISASSD